jgi:hypothetical protein
MRLIVELRRSIDAADRLERLKRLLLWLTMLLACWLTMLLACQGCTWSSLGGLDHRAAGERDESVG